MTINEVFNTIEYYFLIFLENTIEGYLYNELCILYGKYVNRM